jgi:hypothetical protein
LDSLERPPDRYAAQQEAIQRLGGGGRGGRHFTVSLAVSVADCLFTVLRNAEVSTTVIPEKALTSAAKTSSHH